MGNIAQEKNGIIQELFVNSYEVRLLHNNVDLLGLKQYDTLSTQIEKDLLIIKTALEALNLKNNILKFSLATFFFYKFSHRILEFSNRDNLLFSNPDKHKNYIDFLILFREFYIFIILLDSSLVINDDYERKSVGKKYIDELEKLYQNFTNKYLIFGLIKKIYSTQLTQLQQLPQEIMNNNYGVDYEAMINTYMSQINSIDFKFLSDIVNSFREIINSDFTDRYGLLKNSILNNVELKTLDKKAIMRDYEVNAVVNGEKRTDIYKVILFDFELSGIYSNVDVLTVYELTGNTHILNSLIFVLDQFFTSYYLNCFESNGNAGNFKYYINALENRENINYSAILEEHFIAQLEKRETTILAQMNDLLGKMSESDLFSFFKTIEMKIVFSLRDIFYAPNKEMIDGAGQMSKGIPKLTYGDSEFLIQSIQSLLKNMYKKFKTEKTMQE